MHETPPEGLKIRLVEGDEVTRYFYHANGFVDSIAKVGKEVITTEKFIYNDQNQIIKQKTYKKKTTETLFSIYTTSFFTYNYKNQIASTKTYNDNNILKEKSVHNYNEDGTLYNPTHIVKDGNLIQQNAKGLSNTFTFDTHRNPFFNIYPKAYRILKYINKNNITLQVTQATNYTNGYTYTLRYNEQGYIIQKLNPYNPNNSYLSNYYYD
ncbi:MAG: hypothetical protein KIG55_07750 [Myroides sp.]|nr:hypothetical protein [Myroides sp.]